MSTTIEGLWLTDRLRDMRYLDKLVLNYIQLWLSTQYTRSILHLNWFLTDSQRSSCSAVFPGMISPKSIRLHSFPTRCYDSFPQCALVKPIHHDPVATRAVIDKYVECNISGRAAARRSAIIMPNHHRFRTRNHLNANRRLCCIITVDCVSCMAIDEHLSARGRINGMHCWAQGWAKDSTYISRKWTAARILTVGCLNN